MKGVILSAGLGKRLKPLTNNIPKGLIPIINRPLLEYLLLGFKYCNIKHIAIVIGYLGEKIIDYFKNGESLGLDITYINQQNPNGTGSAVLLTREFVNNNPFMLSWGDIILGKENYVNIRESFENEPCSAIIGLNYQENLSQGGAVFLEKTNNVLNIREIVEKPKEKVNTNWNQTGIFILSPIIFEYLEKLTLSERGEYEFTSAIKMMIKDNLNIKPFFIRGFHIEIGDWEGYRNIEKFRNFLEKY